MDLQMPPLAILGIWTMLLWWCASKSEFRKKRGPRRIWTVLWTAVAAIAVTAIIEIGMTSDVLELGATRQGRSIPPQQAYQANIANTTVSVTLLSNVEIKIAEVTNSASASNSMAISAELTAVGVEA